MGDKEGFGDGGRLQLPAAEDQVRSGLSCSYGIRVIGHAFVVRGVAFKADHPVAKRFGKRRSRHMSGKAIRTGVFGDDEVRNP